MATIQDVVDLHPDEVVAAENLDGTQQQQFAEETITI